VAPEHRSSGRIEQILHRFGEVIRVRRDFRQEAGRVAREGNPSLRNRLEQPCNQP
jgi:hypothetical protein